MPLRECVGLPHHGPHRDHTEKHELDAAAAQRQRKTVCSIPILRHVDAVGCYSRHLFWSSERETTPHKIHQRMHVANTINKQLMATLSEGGWHKVWNCWRRSLQRNNSWCTLADLVSSPGGRMLSISRAVFMAKSACPENIACSADTLVGLTIGGALTCALRQPISLSLFCRNNMFHTRRLLFYYTCHKYFT